MQKQQNKRFGNNFEAEGVSIWTEINKWFSSLEEEVKSQLTGYSGLLYTTEVTNWLRRLSRYKNIDVRYNKISSSPQRYLLRSKGKFCIEKIHTSIHTKSGIMWKMPYTENLLSLSKYCQYSLREVTIFTTHLLVRIWGTFHLSS